MKSLLEKATKKSSLLDQLKRVLKFLKRSDTDASLRETIEELIEESNEDIPSIESDERQLLGNVLSLRDLTAHDIMTPRADFIAVSDTLSEDEIMAEFVRTGISWLVVYSGTLDNVIGLIHAKDMLAWIHSKTPFDLKKILRDVMFISPAMRTLDLLLMMRKSGIKLAIVVDEFGGVDGIVTFHTMIEEIIGDIEDSDVVVHTPQLNWRSDGAVLADGRSTLEELDELVGGQLALIDEDADIETLNGLVVYLAGRVPVRGEIIHHPNQMEFEILDADPRCVKRLCIRNIPIKAVRQSTASMGA